MAEGAFTPTVSSSGTDCADCDPNELITQMQEERGRFSHDISQNIQQTDDFLRVLEPSKEEFPSGMGDTVKSMVLDIAQPSERDVLNHQKRLESAKPGNSPCDIPVAKIPYGSHTIEACLFGWAWETDWFCKTDLAFKYKRESQIAQVKEIMTVWSKGIWTKWVRRSYQRSVYNYVLNNALSSRHGGAGYPLVAPNSILTVPHLDKICLRLDDAAGLVGSPKKGSWLIYGGHEEIKALFDHYYKTGARDFGVRQNHSMESHKRYDEELGCETYVLNNYTFIALSHPARYKALEVGQLHYDDALLETIIQSPAEFGTESNVHPDYRNPGVAKFSEWYIVNPTAVRWLTPPVGMTENNMFHKDRQGSNGEGSYSYSGDFIPVRCPEDKDPLGKKVKYHAEFVSGMQSVFPKKGAAILALACHTVAEAIAIDQSGNEVEPMTCEIAIQETQTLLTPNRIQISSAHPLPALEAGESFFLKTQGDKLAKVTVVNSALCEHTGKFITEFQFTNTDLGGCVPRDCDPYKYVSVLPEDTQESDLVDDQGCPLCPGSGNLPEPPSDEITDDYLCASYQGSRVSQIVIEPGEAGEVTITGADGLELEANLAAWAEANNATATIRIGDQSNAWSWKICIDGPTAFNITGVNSAGNETVIDAE